MTRESIQCVRLPLRATTLLLPYSTVAEVVSTSIKAGPSPCLGKVDWRGVNIPVFSLERGCGIPVDVVSGRVRMAVLYGLHQPERLPYYGILLAAIPRTMVVHEGLFGDAKTDGGCTLFGMSSSLEGQEVFIPDLEELETWVIENLP